jgi:hypothetical protein
VLACGLWHPPYTPTLCWTMKFAFRPYRATSRICDSKTYILSYSIIYYEYYDSTTTTSSISSVLKKSATVPQYCTTFPIIPRRTVETTGILSTRGRLCRSLQEWIAFVRVPFLLAVGTNATLGVISKSQYIYTRKPGFVLCCSMDHERSPRNSEGSFEDFPPNQSCVTLSYIGKTKEK